MGKPSNPIGPFSNRQARNKHIVNFVTQTARTFEEETIEDRERFLENEELFVGRQRWDQDNEQEQWQSRVFIHEYAPIIREAAIAVQTMIFEQDDFINLVPDDFANREFAYVLEKLIKYYMKEMFFSQKFYEWALTGAIYGFATWKYTISQCLYWRPEVVIEQIAKAEQKQMDALNVANNKAYVIPDSIDAIEGGLEKALDKLFGPASRKYSPPQVKSKKSLELDFNLEIVNPFNLFWYPDAKDINQSPMMVERSFLKYFELVPMFDSGVLDDSYRDKMKTEGRASSSGNTTAVLSNRETQKWRQRDQRTSSNKYFPDCELLEYFGPLLDDTGDVIQENVHLIVGNGKFVLKDDVNRYWDQAPPYITSVFSRKPFKAIGTGIGDAATGHQKLINNLFSMFFDALQLDVYAPKVINRDMIVDTSQIEAGIRPGENIEVYNGRAEDAISEIPKATASIAPNVFQTVEFLKLAGQKGSSVNTMSSNPSSRARISASEISSNDNRRLQSVSSLSQEVDETCIEKIVQRTKMLVLQFGFEQGNIDKLTGLAVLSESERQLVMGMPSVDRFTEAMKHTKIDVRGFKATVERDKFLSRFAEWLQQINQMPPEAQAKIDWGRVLTDGTESYGFNANNWLRQNTPQDKAHEENALLGLNQQVALWDQDDDLAHLPVHYELMMKMGPVPAAVMHARAHIQRAQQGGKQIPQPPPEIAPVLGIMPQDQNMTRQKVSASSVQRQMAGPMPQGGKGPSRLMQ